MVLALRNVCLSYDQRPVLEGFHLHLGEGQVAGLSGESGCGKSTLLQAMAGMLPANAAVTGRLEVPRRAGYIPQDLLASLSPFLSVGDQVAEVAGSPRDAERLLASLGLLGARLRSSYPHQLSGGERQRVLIALALAAKPDLILADEPTAHLDAATEQLVLRVLLDAVQRWGAALLIASHRESVFRQLGCPVHRLTPFVESAPLERSMPRTDAVLDVRGITKDYFRRDWLLRETPRVRALSDVSFSIRAGETVALVGPSGAGKSTLAHCIAGRERWEAGEILLRVRVQIVPQEPSESLNPRMTIGECFEEACGHADPALLAQVALPTAWMPRKTRELSEGQRARVAIARSIAALNGGLLILDESLSGLDPTTRRHVLVHLTNVQAATGLGCLLIAHDPELATELGARTIRLQGGRVAE